MKQFTFTFLGGVIAYPAIYDIVRSGNVWIGVCIVLAIAALATILALRVGTHSDGRRVAMHCLAFAVGAWLSIAVAFALYLFGDGQSDPKLSVGVSVTLIEAIVIATLGATSIVATALCHRRWATDR